MEWAAEGGRFPRAGPAEALAPGTRPAAPAPATRVLPRLVSVDIADPASDDDRCHAADGSPLEVRCANSLEGRQHAGDAAARAAQLGEAALLVGLDRWYRTEGAGFCRSCELALVEFLRESYGDHLQPFDPLEQLRVSALPPRDRPFARQKEALRLLESIESAKRAVLRARDEARRSRGLEIPVLGRVGTLSAPALDLCSHLDGLVFDLPSLDPMEALLPLLAARAALGLRPAIAMLPASASVAQVRLFGAVTAAGDPDLLIAPGASEHPPAALPPPPHS